MTLTVDEKILHNLTARKKNQLRNFFASYGTQEFFRANQDYPSTIDGGDEKLKFKFNVIKYKTNKLSESRYGFYSKPFNEGYSSSVCKLKGNLIVNNETVEYKSRSDHKPLVVKVIKNHIRPDIVTREWALTDKNLNMKQPVFPVGENAHLLLRDIGVPDLFESDCTLMRTFDQYLDIFQSALEQLDNIHSQGKVHLDIKLENMFYDEKTKTITYIDYGLSKWKDEKHIRGHGTPIYSAKEVLDNEELTSVADIYSLGICFSALLNCQKAYSVCAEKINLSDWPTLRFSEVQDTIIDAPINCRLMMQALLINMTTDLASERISIADALTVISHIRAIKKNPAKALLPSVKEFVEKNIDPLYAEKAHCALLFDECAQSEDSDTLTKLTEMRAYWDTISNEYSIEQYARYDPCLFEETEMTNATFEIQRTKILNIQRRLNQIINAQTTTHCFNLL